MKTLYVSMLLFSFGINVYPQQNNLPPKNEQIKKDTTVEDAFNLRIIQVLEQTADEAKGWDDIKVSSQTQAQIADLIWDFDPISAENYLIRAWEKAKQAKESDNKPSKFRNYSNRVEVSREVLLVARRREPTLAEKWLKELSDLAEEDFASRNNGLFDDRTARSAVLLQMAMQAAETDVQAAASLAAESLKDGISFGFQSVLIKIQEKNPDLAQQVFRSALQRINTVGIKSANEIQILYSYLYTPGRVTTTANAGTQGGSTIAVGRNETKITSAAEIYPALAQEFLQIAGRAIARMPFSTDGTNPQNSAREQFGIINTILYRLGNSSPEISRALRERLNAITANANFSADSPEIDKDISPIRQGEKREDYQSRILDDLIEKSEKIPDPLSRDIFIAQGLLRSDTTQFEKAYGLTDKIRDKNLNEQIADFLIYRASLNKIKNDNFDNAYKLLQKNTEPRQKASSLIVGGQKLIEQKNLLEARDWLNEAQKIFEKYKNTDEDWINIGFGLTSTLAKFDKTEALKQFEATAKIIKPESRNYNLDNAPLAVNFSGLDFSDFTVSTNGFGLNSAIKTFTRQEFENVLTTLDSLLNQPAKGQSIVFICKANLKPKPRPK